MNRQTTPRLYETNYDHSALKTGVLHLGFGAFHRAHQAIYFDDYMQQSGDLAWGITAVNLRREETVNFAKNNADGDGYIVKSMASDGGQEFRRVRSHNGFIDWHTQTEQAENLMAAPSVHVVTITVTESGYYLDANGVLDAHDTIIANELSGHGNATVYGYLQQGLQRRKDADNGGLTVMCCDNIRQNGKMLRANFLRYLELSGAAELRTWVEQNCTFPCSMVDRITPRSSQILIDEIQSLFGDNPIAPVMGEDFTQWVIEDNFAAQMPDLGLVDATVTRDVAPYEEAKIRILNGGHTCLTYLGALKGHETFDSAMNDAELFEHFWGYTHDEVLPALTIDLPFDKEQYLQKIIARFKNASIGDTVERICADGFLKFPIFILPTLRGCLKQGVFPKHGVRAIASWYVFAKHIDAGHMNIQYAEPNWDRLQPMLSDAGLDAFINATELWDNLPNDYPEFSTQLSAAIKEMELTWPV
ncbi:D-arabinitol 4-dehydrogenase [Amylibacter ulvae]|uniref:D-arabinitol 4-dehydrogenase n=1 Tax=Paramylibacter ulvae TaxID=1651968 RepID=A0ABQ3D3M4_9RHOB|nr:mannitol dehydrogenase family protein [Amylibacter ulvae]GHA53087.1 D-arabinitol 4-dehydrogenase [Amylibacter ulvae]